MGVTAMWRSNAMLLVLLILLNTALMTMGTVPWVVLGLLALVGSMYLSFRMGMSLGHNACGVLRTVERARDPESPTHGQLDARTLRQAWSVRRGLLSALVSAAVPFAVSCLYILCMCLGAESLVLPARLLAWGVALPFWPIIASWVEVFTELTPPILAVLLVSPFVLPLCGFAGYLQGPRLWRRTEQAMAEGRRRAKARSRIAKKRAPRAQKPEI